MRKRSLVRLLPYLKRRRQALLIGTATVLLTTAAAALSPWILKEAVDYLVQGNISERALVFFAFLIVVVTAVEGVFRYWMRKILIGMSRQIEFDLRNDLFGHLERMSARFFQTYPTGDLMSRATNDLSAVRAVLGPGIMYFINTCFTVAITVPLLIYLSPSLALLTLIPLAGVSVSVKYFGRKIHERFEKIQEQFSWITTLAQENLSGIRVVKAYNQEKAFIERFRKANDEFIERNLSLVRIWGTFQPLLQFLLGLSLVALLWYGGRQVIQGTISLGDFVAFLGYLAMLTWPTIALGYVINIFERGAASMARLNALFDCAPEVDDRFAGPDSNSQGDIRVRGLNFSYNGVSVLQDIDFDVPAGSTLAIVGRTGSGKSTLVNLLCRLYPVERNRIFIGGREIHEIPLRSLRSLIGYAPQEAFLFSDTIRQNIAFGKPDASIERISAAAVTSNIFDDIQDFPKEFETFVGERGITLSGGQKQRVAISRALLVEPSILILDDSLSAVDTQTEELILQKLSSELERRTALLISHRVSTIRNADQIIVLDRGRIVERGTHDQLLQQAGYYADLYQKQLLQEELDLQ
jgi:ATP-binding cassette, subfamily B, multidrug efflux pump